MNKNQKRPRRTAQFEKKLAAYSLAGAAALIVPGAAKASIVYTNVDETFTEGSSTSSFDFPGSPFAGDITISAQLDNEGLFGFYNDIDASTSGGTQVLLDAPASNGVAALGFNALIDPTSADWGTGGKMAGYNADPSFPLYPYAGDWSSTGGTAFLGFEYEDMGGGLHTGWAEIATTANSSTSSFELLSYAYDTVAGESISTPTATPEPSALPLLALGGIGLIALRRRRAANA